LSPSRRRAGARSRRKIFGMLEEGGWGGCAPDFAGTVGLQLKRVEKKGKGSGKTLPTLSEKNLGKGEGGE